jgi:hypothetical protein
MENSFPETALGAMGGESLWPDQTRALPKVERTTGIPINVLVSQRVARGLKRLR